jgi:hypothetical protein
VIQRRTFVGVGLGIVAVGVAVALIVSGTSTGPHLTSLGGTMPRNYLTVPDMAIDEPLVVGSINLCVDGPGTVAITDVAVQPGYGDLHVRTFGVRAYYDHPLGIGDRVSTLAAFGGGFDLGGPHLVAGRCHDPGDLTWHPAPGDGIVELALEVARTSADIEGGPGLVITYTVDGRTGTYSPPFGIMLCAATCPRPSGW